MFDTNLIAHQEKPQKIAVSTVGHSYIPWLDISKGIGIIMVILAHCIFPFVQIIDYFHMPLFFILSGITYKDKNAGLFLISKINRIFIPYIFFALTSALISLIPHSFGGPFNGPIWFLQDIFVALIIVRIIHILPKYWQYAMIAFLIIASAYFARNPEIRSIFPFAIALAFLSSVFIVFGNAFKSLLLKINSLKKEFLLFISSCAAFLTLTYYAIYQGIGGGYISWTLFSDNYIIAFGLAVTGSLATINISKIIRTCRFLEWCGRNSLVIMCTHFPLAMFLNGYLVKLPFFTTQINKLAIAGFQWIAVFSFSAISCWICKKYLPRLTGYKPLIKS